MTILTLLILAFIVAAFLSRIRGWNRGAKHGGHQSALVMFSPVRTLVGTLIVAGVGVMIIVRAHDELRPGPLVIAAVLELFVLYVAFCAARHAVRMAASFLSCAVPLVVMLAGSGGAHAEGTRTVMWFVGHPVEMKAMLLACRNNPGMAKQTPECENVTQAEILLAAEESRQRFDPTPPSDPKYWRLHPRELAQTVSVCPGMSPRARHYNFCDSAETAMKDSHR